MIFIKNLDEVSNKKDKAIEINTGDIVLVSVGYESKEVELGIAVKGNTLGQVYYVDITSLKTGYKMAKEAAKALAATYVSTHIDTIICLEGTEIIGAFLAESLGESGINSGADVNVVTPELNAVNQMIFRDNTQKKIWGKQVLLLIASVSTGKSINRAMDCLKYYNGNLVGIASIFSAIKENNGTAIHALFTEKDLPDYMTYTSSECPMCKSGQKVDALVNSFGYSKI